MGSWGMSDIQTLGLKPPELWVAVFCSYGTSFRLPPQNTKLNPQKYKTSSRKPGDFCGPRSNFLDITSTAQAIKEKKKSKIILTSSNCLQKSQPREKIFKCRLEAHIQSVRGALKLDSWAGRMAQGHEGPCCQTWRLELDP